MFSHPMLRKCCQAQISPKFLKPEMRKHWQGSNFPKIPKILASMGSAGAIVAQILGIWGNLIPASVFAVQASGILGRFDPCRSFRIGGCPPPMIHCLQKAGSGGSWGGEREHIYIYILSRVGRLLRRILSACSRAGQDPPKSFRPSANRSQTPQTRKCI